jgi:hypothetical protein
MECHDDTLLIAIAWSTARLGAWANASEQRLPLVSTSHMRRWSEEAKTGVGRPLQAIAGAPDDPQLLIPIRMTF